MSSNKIDIERLDALFEDAFNFHSEKHPDEMRMAALAWERLKLRSEAFEKLLDQVRFFGKSHTERIKNIRLREIATSMPARRLEVVASRPAPPAPPTVPPPPVKQGYKHCCDCAITKRVGMFISDAGEPLPICVFCHRSKCSTPPAPASASAPQVQLERENRVEFAPIPAELENFRLTKLAPSEGLNIPTAYGRDYPKK